MSEKEKRFSVIIIAYNIEDYIEKAIESVENQTLKDIEIIVVDDASTDKTKQKILNMQAKYNNITYIEHEENKKLGGARNTALKIAKGEYIVFLDGDDELAENDVLERLDKLIGKDQVDVVYLGFKMVGTKNEIVIPTEETCTKEYRAAQDKYPNAWSKCWRREFLEENNIIFKEKRLYEDVLFVYNGVVKAKNYKIADFIVHKYTSGRTNSITTTIHLRNVEDTIKNINDLLAMRESEYTEIIDMIIKREINKCKTRLDNVYDRLFA